MFGRIKRRKERAAAAAKTRAAEVAAQKAAAAKSDAAAKATPTATTLNKAVKAVKKVSRGLGGNSDRRAAAAKRIEAAKAKAAAAAKAKAAPKPAAKKSQSQLKKESAANTTGTTTRQRQDAARMARAKRSTSHTKAVPFKASDKSKNNTPTFSSTPPSGYGPSTTTKRTPSTPTRQGTSLTPKEKADSIQKRRDLWNDTKKKNQPKATPPATKPMKRNPDLDKPIYGGPATPPKEIVKPTPIRKTPQPTTPKPVAPKRVDIVEPKMIETENYRMFKKGGVVKKKAKK